MRSLLLEENSPCAKAAEQNTYTPFVQHHVLIGQRSVALLASRYTISRQFLCSL